MAEKRERILWPMDALDPELERQSDVLNVIQPLVQATRARVEPVYVLNWAQASLGPMRHEEDLDFFFKQARERFTQWAKKHRHPWLMEPKILVSDSRMQRGAVDSLCQYAEETGARLIVTKTHARQGVPRWFLGSFAESLLLRSCVPVLTIGPTAKAISKPRPILFPTDFGKQSDLILPQVVGISKALGAPLIIFHAEETSSGGAILPGAYPISGRTGKLSEAVPVPRAEAVRVRKKAEEYLNTARAAGAKAEVALDRKSGAIFDRIFALVKKNPPSLIAMAAQSGPFRSAFAGSIARQVVRSAQCPVWILHEVETVSKREKRKKAA